MDPHKSCQERIAAGVCSRAGGERPHATGRAGCPARFCGLWSLFCVKCGLRRLCVERGNVVLAGVVRTESGVHFPGTKMSGVFARPGQRRRAFDGRYSFPLQGNILTSWSDHTPSTMGRLRSGWVRLGTADKRAPSQRLVIGAVHLRIFCGAAQQDAKVGHFIEMKGGDPFGRGDGDEVGAVHIVEIETGARVG